MKEKFQKIFGTEPVPNDPAVPSFADDVNEAVQSRRVARLTMRRRLLGLAAMVLLALIVVPAFFEPDLATVDRKALTVIPPLVGAEEAVVTDVKPAVTETKPERPQPTADERSVRSTATALSAANPVSAGMKAAPGVTDESDPIGTLLKEKPAVKPPVKKESHPVPVKTAEKAIEKPAAEAVKSVAKPAPAKTTVASDPAGRWYIQLFATANKTAAETKAKALERLGLPSYIEPVKRRGTDLWRVRVGRFATMADAKKARDILTLNNESHGGISQLPAEKK